MSDPWHIVDDEPADPAPREPEDRLDALRIRAIAHERRAAHRRLLWARAIAFLFACAAALTAVEAIRGSGAKARWYALGAALFLVLAVRAARRIRLFKIPSHTPDTTRPPPDAFDALSNGEQFRKSLDDLNR